MEKAPSDGLMERQTKENTLMENEPRNESINSRIRSASLRFSNEDTESGDSSGIKQIYNSFKSVIACNLLIMNSILILFSLLYFYI